MASDRKRWVKKDPHNERGRIAVRWRAYPTAEQRQKSRQIGGCCRKVKNLAKEQRDLAWRYGRHRVTYTTQTGDLKSLRDDPDLAPYLAEVPAQILQQALKDTDDAYKRFVKGEAGYPNWVCKSGGSKFRDPQGVQVERLSRRWGQVKIQGIGWVKVRMHRPPIGSRVCSATWVEEPDGKVFISVLFERHKRQPTKPRIEDWSTAVGVDRGVAVAIAISPTADNPDGVLVDRDMWTPGEKERLMRLERRREHQKIARKKANRKIAKETRSRASNNQIKTERAIAALHARARRRRRDFAEQESMRLAKNHRLTAFEDLHIPAMTKAAAAKPDPDHPGRWLKNGKAAKSALNRGILDKGWGMVCSRTAEKSLRHGHLCVVVPAPGTSITCKPCGTVDPASRASRSMFICVHCGYRAHADINASEEIRERGIKLAPTGGTPVAAPIGNNYGPVESQDHSGAETRGCEGLGSGNQKTDYITCLEVA